MQLMVAPKPYQLDYSEGGGRFRIINLLDINNNTVTHDQVKRIYKDMRISLESAVNDALKYADPENTGNKSNLLHLFP
jgi:hypothetical protein